MRKLSQIKSRGISYFLTIIIACTITSCKDRKCVPSIIVIDNEKFICCSKVIRNRLLESTCLDTINNQDTLLRAIYHNDSMTSFKSFYKNGQLKMEGQLFYDNMIDTIKSYHAKSVLSKYEFYVRDFSIGGTKSIYTKIFNENGELLSLKMPVLVEVGEKQENGGRTLSIQLAHSMYRRDSLRLVAILDTDNSGVYTDTVYGEGYNLKTELKPHQLRSNQIKGILFELGGIHKYGGQHEFEVDILQ